MKKSNKNIAIVLNTIITVLLFSTGIFAQDNSKGLSPISEDLAKSGTVRAVIVGVSHYKNIQSLEYADKDARSFYAFLRSAAGGYVDSTNIILLTNEKATAAQVFAALDWITKESKEGDLAIFYFSGHGDLETKTIRQNGFLLAYDAPEAAYMAGGTIGINYLQDYLETIVTKDKSHVVLISDACKSGKLAGGIEGAKQTTAALQANWSNIVKILSSQPGELSYESNKWGNGAGVFTYYLLKGLMGMADMNHDKEVSLKELDIYLAMNIPKDTDFKQNPTINGNAKTIIADVDSLTYASLLMENNVKPTGELLAMRGNEATTTALDTTTSGLLKKFNTLLDNGKLIEPTGPGKNAWDIYNTLKPREDLAAIVSSMKSSLIASLQDKSQIVINSFLRGTDQADTINLYTAYEELELAFNLIDKDYILYNPIKARYLYMKSLIYNNDSQIQDRIKLLKESVEIQPDAAYALCELGLAYRYAKQYDEAKMNLKAAINLSPTWAYPWNNLGIVYADLDQNDSALVCYKKSSELMVYAKPFYNMGIIYDNTEQLDKAIENYKKALSIDPNYQQAYNNLGLVYKKQNKLDEAKESYIKAFTIDPYYATPYYNLGILYFDKEDYDNAIKYYEKAVANDKNFTDAYFNLALSYYDVKNYSKALENYKKVISLDSTYASAYKGIGDVFEDLKEYENAITYFQKASALKADYTTAIFNIGFCYKELGDNLKAIEYYDKAIALKSDYPSAYYNLGIIYSDLDNSDKAAEFYLKAISYKPEYADAYFNLAILYNDKGQTDKAIECYKKVVEITPNDEAAFNNLGLLYKDLEKYPDAIECYNKSIAINPKYLKPYYNLGIVYSKLGQTDKAIQKFKQVLEIDSTYYNAYWYIGFVNDDLKNYEVAAENYKKVLSLVPDDKGTMYKLGYDYELLGDYNTAASYYKQIIQLDPSYAGAFYYLGECQMNLGDYKNAILNYQKSIDLSPSSYYVGYYYIGKIYDTYLQDYDNSIANYTKYIELNPSYHFGYQGRGYAYLHKGDKANALLDLKKVTLLKPDDPAGYYDLACYYSLDNDATNSINYLEKAFIFGYTDFKHINEDKDLDNIRNNDAFKKLIEKYNK